MKHYRDDSLVLNPGELRHQIVIEQPAYTKSASGVDVPGWSTFLHAKAFFGSTRARQFFASDREEVEKLYPVEMRWQAGIRENMRVRFDGRVFEIMTAVNVQERNRILLLNMREVT